MLKILMILGAAVWGAPGQPIPTATPDPAAITTPDATEAAAAQPDTAPLLTVAAVRVEETIDAYGGMGVQAVGQIVNDGEQAYTDLSLYAAVFNQADTLIAEGYGVAVDACGAGRVFDFALQPGGSTSFAIPLEALDGTLNRREAARVVVQADATGLEPTAAVPLAEGITAIAPGREIITVEWLTPTAFQYAEGCARRLSIDWTWTRYDTRSDRATPLEAPRADLVTDDLRRVLELTDESVFQRSALRFAPTVDRLVYQDAANRFITTTETGGQRRLIANSMFNRSLQGIYWLPETEGRFLAYYYGAYGEPVLYFTANTDAQLYSPDPARVRPSQTVPGVARDAVRAVLGGTFDGVTGYHLWVMSNNFFETLIETTRVPGNNFPAPLPVLNEAGDMVMRVILALPTDEAATTAAIACYDRESDRLRELAPLPLRLSTDERASWWLSPDGGSIHLAATGASGGLWTIDLDAIGGC